MAVSQEVVLKVLAQVADAVKGLNQVLGAVRSLASETKANTPLKLDVQIGEGLAQLKELKKNLQETIKAAAGGGKISLAFDVSSIDKELRDLAARVKTGVNEIKGSFDNLSKVKVNLGLAKKGSEEFQRFQAELKNLESQFQGAVNRLNTASRGVTFDPISRSATIARDKVRIAAENMAEFLAKIPAAVQKDEAAFASLQAKIEGLRAAAARLSQIQVVPPGGVPAAASLTSSIGSLEKAFALAAAAGQLFFASIVVQKLLDFGKSAVKVASDLQILTGQLDIFVGGPDAAAEVLDRLRAVADDVGISFLSLTENFQKFLVPAQSAGLSLNETIDIFTAISVSLAGAGKSAEEVNGVFKTFTDVMQKGVIQAEELVKQFANNGIPATSLLAKAYGKTTAELREMTASHQILARDGIPALAAEMLKVYGPAALKNVESFRSENERFKNEILDLKKAFGDELLPALVEVLQTLKSFDGEGTFAQLGADLATIIRLAGDLARIFNDFKNFDLKAAFVGVDVLFLNLAATGVQSFGVLEEAAARLSETLGLAPEGFAEAVEKSVDQAVEKLRFAAKEARKTGEEARKGAEEGGEGVDDLAKHWEDLYNNLKRQQKEHQQSAGKSEEELTKKQLAEIKKRREAYKSFFQELAELSKPPEQEAPEIPGAPSSVKGPSVEAGDSSALDQLRADLAAALDAKRELSLQPSVSTEDLAQIEQYRAKIQDLEAQIASYGVASSAAADEAAAAMEKAAIEAAEAAAKVESELGGKALEALRKLITGTDEFAKAFAELGPKAQQQITGLVQAFEQAAASGNVSRQQIEQFGQSLIQAFQQGGLVGQEFASQLAAAFGSTGAAAGSLAGVLRGLADGTIAAASSLEDAGAKAQTTASSIDHLLERTDAAAAGFIEVRGESDQLKEGLYQVGLAAKGAEGNFIGVRDAAGNLGPNLLETAEDAKTAKSEIDGVAVAAAKASENFIGVRDAAGNVGPNLLEVKEGADKAKEGVDNLSKTEPPTKLAEGLDATAESAKKVVDPIKSIAESTAKLGDATQTEGTAKLGEALTALSGPAAALAPPLELVAGAASRLSQAVNALLAEPGLGTIESQLTPLVAPVQQLTEPAAALAVAIEKLGQAVQTIKADGLVALTEAGAKLATIAEPANSAAKALEPLSAVTATLGQTFATANVGASTLTANLAAIGAATGDLVASLSDPALVEGLSGLSESLATAAPDLATVATELDRFATALDASKVSLPEVQSGIEAIAESVGKPEVKDGLADLASSIDKISDSATGAGEGLVVVGESLGAISGSADKAAKGLAEIAKSLDAEKLSKGASAIEKLGTSSASAATGTQNLADAAKDARAEAALLTAEMESLAKAEAKAKDEAIAAAPAIRGALATAVKQLNVPLSETREHFDKIREAIDYLGGAGAQQVSLLTVEVRALAAAWLQVASAANAAKQSISGVRLPPVVSQSGAS